MVELCSIGPSTNLVYLVTVPDQLCLSGDGGCFFVAKTRIMRRNRDLGKLRWRVEVDKLWLATWIDPPPTLIKSPHTHIGIQVQSSKYGEIPKIHSKRKGLGGYCFQTEWLRSGNICSTLEPKSGQRPQKQLQTVSLLSHPYGGSRGGDTTAHPPSIRMRTPRQERLMSISK
jgi:hypothetical protein